METKTVKVYLASLTVLYIALLMGISVFLAIVLFVTPPTKLNINLEQVNLGFLVSSLIFGLGGIVLSRHLSQMKNKTARTLNTLGEKLQSYTVSLILKLALIEAPILLAIVFYFLEEEVIFLAIALVLILYFVAQKPNVNTIAMDLELNQDERNILNNPDSVL